MSKKKQEAKDDAHKTSQDSDHKKWFAGALLALKIPQGEIAGLVGISSQHLNRVWHYDPIVERPKAEYEEKLTGEIEPLFFALVWQSKKEGSVREPACVCFRFQPFHERTS